MGDGPYRFDATDAFDPATFLSKQEYVGVIYRKATRKKNNPDDLYEMTRDELASVVATLPGKPMLFDHEDAMVIGVITGAEVVGAVSASSRMTDGDDDGGNDPEESDAIVRFRLDCRQPGACFLYDTWRKTQSTGKQPYRKLSLTHITPTMEGFEVSVCKEGRRPGAMIIRGSRSAESTALQREAIPAAAPSSAPTGENKATATSAAQHPSLLPMAAPATPAPSGPPPQQQQQPSAAPPQPQQQQGMNIPGLGMLPASSQVFVLGGGGMPQQQPPPPPPPQSQPQPQPQPQTQAASPEQRGGAFSNMSSDELLALARAALAENKKRSRPGDRASTPHPSKKAPAPSEMGDDEEEDGEQPAARQQQQQQSSRKQNAPAADGGDPVDSGDDGDQNATRGHDDRSADPDVFHSRKTQVPVGAKKRRTAALPVAENVQALVQKIARSNLSEADKMEALDVVQAVYEAQHVVKDQRQRLISTMVERLSPTDSKEAAELIERLVVDDVQRAGDLNKLYGLIASSGRQPQQQQQPGAKASATAAKAQQSRAAAAPSSQGMQDESDVSPALRRRMAAIEGILGSGQGTGVALPRAQPQKVQASMSAPGPMPLYGDDEKEDERVGVSEVPAWMRPVRADEQLSDVGAFARRITGSSMAAHAPRPM